MNIEAHRITINGLPVQVVRKDIKNLHLGVYPPNGRVRVAAPLHVSDKAVRLAVIGKLGWIKRQRAKFDAQPRQSTREMINGESHYFLGQRFRLRVAACDGAAKVVLSNKSVLKLHIRQEATAAQREQALARWYREQLRELIPPLLDKWQASIGVQLADWAIKKMKTKWGSCNRKVRRIWLNLELAKKPTRCIEYILVHELIHLIERKHNDRFIALMDEHLPQWRLYRQELNAEPLAHEKWSY